MADPGFKRDAVGCYDWSSSVLKPTRFDSGSKISVVSAPDVPGVQHLLDAFNRCF